MAVSRRGWRRTAPSGAGPRRAARAVSEYQRPHGLVVAGIVGPPTRASLFPIGVATVAISGMRLRMPEPPRFGPAIRPPNLLPGQLQLGPLLDQEWRTWLAGKHFSEPLRLPGLAQPIDVPVVPDWNL